MNDVCFSDPRGDYFFKGLKTKESFLHECTGVYESNVSYSEVSGRQEVRYFEKTSAWAEDIPMRFELNEKRTGRYIHRVWLHDELKEFYTHKRIKSVKGLVQNGEAKLYEYKK